MKRKSEGIRRPIPEDKVFNPALLERKMFDKEKPNSCRVNTYSTGSFIGGESVLLILLLLPLSGISKLFLHVNKYYEYNITIISVNDSSIDINSFTRSYGR